MIQCNIFRELYYTCDYHFLHFRVYSYSKGKRTKKKKLLVHSVAVRFGPLFVDEKGIFVATRSFMMYPHGTRSTATSARTFFSEIDLRGSFLPYTKACPVKGGLCQGTLSEGFARRKVIWDRKLHRERVARQFSRCSHIRSDSDGESYRCVQSVE